MTEQLAPIGRVGAHALLTLYTAAALSVTLEIPAAATPGLETVSVKEVPRSLVFTVPKFRAVGDTATNDAIPARVTIFEDDAKLKATDPVREPAADGTKATVTTQL